MFGPTSFKAYVLTLALVSLAGVLPPALAQQKQAGEHIPITLDTPQDYVGTRSGEAEVRWSYTLRDPKATYVALHFQDFDLAPGDYLIVSDEFGGQEYTLELQGKQNAGTFWARHIKGNAAVLTLVVTNPEGGAGFVIDEYVAGFMDLGTPSYLRAICGTDDKENAKCYETSHPTEYDRGRAVCRLLSNGSGFCTGWLVSSENHVITNEHCVTSASEALNTDFDFMGEAPTCATPNCDDCFQGTVYGGGGTYIQDSYNYDYCLMQINVLAGEADPSATFGWLEIDNRVATIGEEIYIIGHPGGRAKEFSIYSTYAGDTGGIPRVSSITEPPCHGSGYYDVGYFADTEGGSSGSPVLARASHKVIALHHCADCPNRGVPIHLIYPEIEQYLTPGPAGTVTFDKGRYGCADTVSVELRDGDLQGLGTHTVTITTANGDAETITVTETGANTAIFVGTVDTGTLPVIPQSGRLELADGETITVTYVDANDGAGGLNVTVTDTATADCVAPAVVNVQVTNIEPHSASVVVDATEPVRATVFYGTSCGNLTHATSTTVLADPSTVNLTGLLDDTTYYFTVEIEDEAANTDYDDNGGACHSFTTPEIQDFYTQQFDTETNDLSSLGLTFVPNGSIDYYSGCVEPIDEFPSDPNGGTTLTLTDNTYATVTLPVGTTVSLYGTSYNKFYVGSNGYITFTAGDVDSSESFADHFDTPRISGVFDDLNPTTGGTVSWKQFDDHIAVTYLNVPEYGSTTKLVTFQVEMFFDGTITINYGTVGVTDGLAGLSQGLGVSPYFVENDLSALGDCGPKPPKAKNVNLTTPVGLPAMIALLGQDDGLPDPPAALTYIIETLPAHGKLYDPLGAAITSAPYTLLSHGSQVQFRPNPLYAGPDGFDYRVNDGGVPPEGGDSNSAHVAITIGGPTPVHVFNLDVDPQWTTEGAWEFGQPLGGGGGGHGGPDPTAGHTGVNVYGYNLEGNYGLYLPGYHLTTTALDCTPASDVSLRFWRWLGVEQPAYDKASIAVSHDGVNWTMIWQNPTEIADLTWVFQEFDISSFADYQSTVYVRWTMGPTDGSRQYCGWNIDDIEIWGIVPPEPDGDMNCDGEITFADINPFVMALLDPAEYALAYPSCDIMNADIDDDGSVGFGDINPFVALLLN